ncbi:protein kinase [Sorangium sp. So ce1014]|uniref:serine/threonine-protein kinase n=1 Tax=Sorangium sp. So ce1014 TaxID=3133326 RepID=UPI003F62227C
MYDEDVTACPADGNPLLPTRLSLPAEPLLAAHTMVGEYRIERKLGAGTFGEVYAGEHPIIGKQVAIKVLNGHFAAQPRAVARFVAEARAVNRIRQRNIIDIFSFGVLQELQRHYFVMELLDGLTLGELCRRRRRLPFPTIVPILRGIADALDAVHEAGITHRDLKPDNVFLAAERDGTWFPKLLDFGIAKLADGSEETSTGVVLGTPQYMAPEQARGQRIGPPADIYALGVMIHKMLTGKHLFTGESAVEMMYKHVSDPPPRMSSVCADLPRELDLPVLAMLEKRAGDRPPSASRAVAALLDAARGIGLTRGRAPEEPVSAPPVATWAPGETRSTTEVVAPASATWTSGLASSALEPAATEEVGPASGTWTPGGVSPATEDVAPVSATWSPGLAPAAREDAATLETGAPFETGPSATAGSWAPDRCSDAGTVPTPEPSTAPGGSAIAVTESTAGPMASPGGATLPKVGPPAGGVDPVRGADAGDRSSLRELAAVEAPSIAPAARATAARRWKLLVATAAGLLAATWMWAAGRPAGLPPLDGSSAVALASAAVVPPPPLDSAAAAPAPLASAAAAPAPLASAAAAVPGAAPAPRPLASAAAAPAPLASAAAAPTPLASAAAGASGAAPPLASAAAGASGAAPPRTATPRAATPRAATPRAGGLSQGHVERLLDQRE